MKEYLNFDKMVTPLIIKIVFWVLVGIAEIAAIGMIIAGANSPFGGGMATFMGFMMLIFSPLLIRIYCEILIVLFKLYETTRKIANQTEKVGDRSIQTNKAEINETAPLSY